jgi:hypothetical protein
MLHELRIQYRSRNQLSRLQLAASSESALPGDPGTVALPGVVHPPGVAYPAGVVIPEFIPDLGLSGGEVKKGGSAGVCGKEERSSSDSQPLEEAPPP